MKIRIMTLALAIAVSTINAFAQDSTGASPQASGSAGAPSGDLGQKHGGFHLLPPHAKEELNLTADQQKQLADLETEVKSKLEKILTADQQQKLKQMRPPPPPRQSGRSGGVSSSGGDGPNGGGNGGSQSNQQPPPPPPDND